MGLLLQTAQGVLNAAWRIGRRSPSKALPAGSIPVAAGSRGGWLNVVREPFTTAWQRNVEINTNTVLTYSTVFSCISLIASDISKLRMRLVKEVRPNLWEEVEGNSPFWAVLREPNHYQTPIQFWAQWIESKLIHGNTFVLVERDNRGGTDSTVGVARRLYVLDPTRVTPHVTSDGAVWYQLRSDYLNNLSTPEMWVPASEIIHDRWNTFFHPLLGTSPITAAGLAATQGLKIQESSTQFFAAGAHPGGVLTAPGKIDQPTAERLKEYWDTNYGNGGPSVGKVAVLGDGLKYEAMMMTSTDAQLLEQLKWTAETVVSVFHVPGYKVGIGPAPTVGSNVEALNQVYYSDCLQGLIEAAEVLMDRGLKLPRGMGTEFDLDGLLRMDGATRATTAKTAIDSGAVSPDEARLRYFDLGPVEGGNTPYMQQQNFSLAALAKRDRDDPFAKPEPPAAPVAANDNEDEEAELEAARALSAMRKGLG